MTFLPHRRATGLAFPDPEGAAPPPPPPPGPRFWSLPIELLWKVRVNYGIVEDVQINIELDLLGAGYSFAGVLLQNYTSDVPSMLIDTYGRGELASPGGLWLDQLNDYYAGGLPDPDARWIWVRQLIEANGSWARAWFDGNSEPSSYQVHQYDASSTRLFDPSQDFTLYAYLNTNGGFYPPAGTLWSATGGPGSIEIEQITIIQGYGTTQLVVDDFERTVAPGSWGQASSGPLWVPGLAGERLEVASGWGRFFRTDPGHSTAADSTLLLPDGATL